jgi:hypothetical protein
MVEETGSAWACLPPPQASLSISHHPPSFSPVEALGLAPCSELRGSGERFGDGTLGLIATPSQAHYGS